MRMGHYVLFYFDRELDLYKKSRMSVYLQSVIRPLFLVHDVHGRHSLKKQGENHSLLA